MDIIKVSAHSRSTAVAGAIAGMMRESRYAEVQACRNSSRLTLMGRKEPPSSWSFSRAVRSSLKRHHPHLLSDGTPGSFKLPASALY
jgi:hypothetical protein